MSSSYSATNFSVAKPDEGSLRFLRDRDLGLIIRVTVRLIQDQFAEIAAGVGLIAGPAYMMVAAFGAFVDPTDVGQQSAVSFVGVLPGLLLTASVVAYIRLYRSGYEGQISVGDVWEEAKPLILPTLTYQFLLGLAFMLLAVLLIGVGALGGPAGIAVGAVLAIAGALWAMPIFLVGLIVRLVEEESVTDSFTRAMELVAARRGMAYGTTAVIFLLTMFVVMAVAGAFGAVVAVASDPTNPSPLFLGLSSALTYLFLMIASVLYTLASAFLHGSLVDSLEGTALMDEIDDLGSAPDLSEREFDGPSIRGALRQDSVPEVGATTADAPREPPPSGFRGGGFDPPAS